MRTIKRNVNEVNTSLSSYNKIVKYYNQLEWKGIVENKNLFTTDQQSQADAKNVYVDDYGSLVSRPVLHRAPLSRDILPINSELIDTITYGKVKIYVSNEEYAFENHYKIVAVGDSTAILKDINDYHISTIENYIICFNNKGAKIFDINNQSAGWQDLNKFVEIPVIKRVVGSEITEYNKNQFTSQYKEQYIWSNVSKPQLPSSGYNVSKGIDLTVNADNSPFNWHIPVSTGEGTLDKTQLMQYMTFRKIQATVDTSGMSSVNGALPQGRFASKGNIICISDNTGVSVSFDNGSTFTKEYLPYSQEKYEGFIADITDDGLYYMRVNHDGVHVLSLGDLRDKNEVRWELISPWNDSSKTIQGTFSTFSLNLNNKGYQYCAHFITKDIFAFIVETNVGPVLWFMAPGLVGHSSIGYNPNSTNGTTGHNTPILSEDTIDAKYVGTLCCSEVFQRDFANSFCLAIENKYTWSNGVESAMRNASLRIIKDHGTVLENANKDGSYQSERKVEKDYYTIAITILGNRMSNTSFFTNIILPGSQCIKYTDGTYEPLCFDNRHWNDTFATMGIFGPSPVDYGGSIDTHSNTGYNIAQTISSSGTEVESFPSTKSGGNTNWIFNYPPRNIRVNSIQKISKWSVGKYAGQEYNDQSQYTGHVSVGLWQIKGSVFIENLPELNDENNADMSRYYDTCWYEFTAEFGFPKDELSCYGAFQLTARMISYSELTVPFKVGSTDYFLGNAAYVPAYNYSTNTDWYSVWLDTPTQIWDNDSDRNFGETLIGENGRLFIRCNNEVYTNILNDEDTVTIDYYYGTESTDKYTQIPNVSYSDTELYLGFNNQLSITANTKDSDGNILFNLPKLNNQKFIENITNIINISTTDIALFFEDNIVICSKVQDETLGYRYDYYPSKLSTGTRLGDSVINTIEGNYTIFPTKRGLAFMNYQAFMATTDQVLTYITDNIEDRYDEFYKESESIKIIQKRTKLFLTNGTNKILIYDLEAGAWWYWELPNLQYNSLFRIKKLTTDQIDLFVVGRRLYKFGDQIREYKDFEALSQDEWGEDSWGTTLPQKIDWFIISQPLHMKAINYYKNLKQLIFQILDDNNDDKQHTITVQIRCYRKKLDTKEPELIAFKIEELRTFVKRFNYWKINEVQYALGSDNETLIPTKLRLNGVSIKYELGEEVR